MCIDVNFILTSGTVGSYVLCVSTHYTLAMLTREDTVTEKISAIDEIAHVAIVLQLLEMSSIRTPKCLQIYKRYIFISF